MHSISLCRKRRRVHCEAFVCLFAFNFNEAIYRLVKSYVVQLQHCFSSLTHKSVTCNLAQSERFHFISLGMNRTALHRTHPRWRIEDLRASFLLELSSSACISMKSRSSICTMDSLDFGFLFHIGTRNGSRTRIIAMSRPFPDLENTEGWQRNHS